MTVTREEIEKQLGAPWSPELVRAVVERLLSERDAESEKYTNLVADYLVIETDRNELSALLYLAADEAITRSKERDAALKECEEQARLLGISGSREAKLIAEKERLTKERDDERKWREAYREVAKLKIVEKERMRGSRPFDVHDESAFYNEADSDARRIYEGMK